VLTIVIRYNSHVSDLQSYSYYNNTNENLDIFQLIYLQSPPTIGYNLKLSFRAYNLIIYVYPCIIIVRGYDDMPFLHVLDML